MKTLMPPYIYGVKDSDYMYMKIKLWPTLIDLQYFMCKAKQNWLSISCSLPTIVKSLLLVVTLLNKKEF